MDVSEDENFISMTWLEEMNYAALTIQRGWRWTRKRIVLRAASEERLQEKLREVLRRLVACSPVGVSAKKKTESLKEMESTQKAVEKEWRMLFNEELANLELEKSGVVVLWWYDTSSSTGMGAVHVSRLLRCCD